LQEFISLVTRHWNATCDTLQSGNVFLPLLLDDESGVARANDWANGFMRGMEMRRGGWAGLMDDEEPAGSLVPILALAHEHHPDPEMRTYKEPISAEMRESSTQRKIREAMVDTGASWIRVWWIIRPGFLSAAKWASFFSKFKQCDRGLRCDDARLVRRMLRELLFQSGVLPEIPRRL
jgi:hypothetical protein